MLDVLLEYLKSRRQFGRHIGSYQSLKHPTVDILIGLERSRSLLYRAATLPSQYCPSGSVMHQRSYGRSFSTSTSQRARSRR